MIKGPPIMYWKHSDLVYWKYSILGVHNIFLTWFIEIILASYKITKLPSAFAGVKSGYIRGDKDMMIAEGKVVYMESALG